MLADPAGLASTDGWMEGIANWFEDSLAITPPPP